jgi:hypothetical protein
MAETISKTDVSSKIPLVPLFLVKKEVFEWIRMDRKLLGM